MFPGDIQKKTKSITRDIESESEYTTFIFDNASVCTKIAKRLRRKKVWHVVSKKRRSVLIISPRDFNKVVLSKHHKKFLKTIYTILK